jgi:hypothetical protein
MATAGMSSNRMAHRNAGIPFRNMMSCAVALLLIMCAPWARLAQAQSYYIVLTPPIVDRVDGNHVSMITGKTQFTIPALKMGDVEFTPYAVEGTYFGVGAVFDHNYGRIATCTNYDPTADQYSGTSDCVSADQGLQAIYGEERETFSYASGQYSPDGEDGATFVDNGSTCTWTERDGTQIVYAAYHVSGDPRCYSNNILQVTHPDGRIATYYYYGAFSTSYDVQTPIISIATNSGYLLKYNYSGTPAVGGETSVTAINRAFEACDPAALSCTLSQSSWPTAMLSWTTKELTSNCDDFSTASGYDPCRHYIFTIQDESHKNSVFELDSYSRIVSYQPPDATQPAYYYSLCSLLANNTLKNCWSYTTWPPSPSDVYGGAVEPLLFDWVENVTHNGQTWSYGYSFDLGAPPGWTTWSHFVNTPLGTSMQGTGNGTPGEEMNFGPTDSVTLYDGTVAHFERSRQNLFYTQKTPNGLTSMYCYDLRGNLEQTYKFPSSGSATCTGMLSGSVIQESAVYPTTCTDMVTCNKPTAITDANGNTSTFTYDPVHGGVLTVTGPAVNGVQPQTRYTYVQRNAWYLSSSGVMTRDPNPIWLKATESYCMTGSASGSGCALANDEVVTTYDYGPDSGPNNLILRGQAVTANGQTLRTCYGHDEQGNEKWQTSPNANPSSCPTY